MGMGGDMSPERKEGPAYEKRLGGDHYGAFRFRDDLCEEPGI